MSVTPDLVDRIAHLSRLTIDTQQLEPITADFNEILTLIDQIDGFAVAEELEPTTSPQPLRDDVAESDTIDPTLFQKNAPAVDDQLYLVPDVIDTTEE